MQSYSEYRAHSRFFQPNTQHPIYPELKKIIAKTAGVEGRLKELFSQMKGVKMAFLYGSFAKGKERKDSDIDLLVVGNPRIEDQLLKQIPKLEKEFQREINYKLYSDKEYREKRAKDDPFLEEVLTDKTILLKGSPNAI